MDELTLGRKEHTHRELGKPHSPRFPTAPTAVIYLSARSHEKHRCSELISFRRPLTPKGRSAAEDARGALTRRPPRSYAADPPAPPRPVTSTP